MRPLRATLSFTEHRAKTTTWLVPTAVVVIAMTARLPFLSVPMISDEGGYLYVAKYWNHSYQLYRDIPFDRPQGIFLIYKLIVALIGDSVRAIRVAAAVWNAASAMAVYFVARDLLRSSWAGLAAGVLFAIVSSAPHIEGFTANAELFAVLPLILSAHLAYRGRYILAAFLAGVSFVLKPIGVSGLLLTLWCATQRQTSWRTLVLAIAGFAVLPLLSLAHACSVDCQGFVGHLALKLSADSGASGDITGQTQSLIASAAWTLSCWLPLAILGLLGWRDAPADVRSFATAWLITSILGMAIGGNWSWHYWTQLVPPLAFIAAMVVCRFERGRGNPLVAMLIGVAVALFVAVDGPFWWLNPRELSARLYNRPAYVVESEVGDFIRHNTVPTDTIYVAFAEAELYPLADRRASVPYLYWYAINSSSQVLTRVLASVQSREPAWVVWANEPPQRISVDEFARKLKAAGYCFDRAFGSIRLYRRR